MKRTRKGQLQIGESMLVILFVLIVGVVALVFTTNMAQERFEVKLNEYEELNAVELGQIVTSLYDIRCSKTGLETTCVDLHKVEAVVTLQQTRSDLFGDYYRELFKDSEIVLTIAYPPSEQDKRFVIYSSDAIRKDSQGKVIAGQTQSIILIPVSVYNGVYDTVGFGMLSIARYQAGRTPS